MTNKKKGMLIGGLIIVLAIAACYLFFNKAGTSNENGCEMRCENNNFIPCESNNDCKTDPMMKFCNQREIIFKNGFTGYCKDKYCQAYGCGGAPSID